MKNIAYYIKLIRPINLGIALFTQLIFVAISTDWNWSNVRAYDLILIIIAILFTTAGGYVVNDLFDIEIDKINKPIRQFIPTKISYRYAYIYYFILAGLGVLCGFLVGPFLGVTVLITNLLLFYYSRDLKKSAFFGNALVAFLSALVVFLAPSYGCTLVRSAYIAEYSLLAFLITFAREIIKDIEDIDGDREHEGHTLPIDYGVGVSKWIAAVNILLSIAVLLFLGNAINQWPYTAAITITIGLMIWSIYKLTTISKKEEYHKLATLQKWILFIGIITVLFVGK